jgi:hypothetical protein
MLAGELVLSAVVRVSRDRAARYLCAAQSGQAILPGAPRRSFSKYIPSASACKETAIRAT